MIPELLITTNKLLQHNIHIIIIKGPYFNYVSMFRQNIIKVGTKSWLLTYFEPTFIHWLCFEKRELVFIMAVFLAIAVGN